MKELVTDIILVTEEEIRESMIALIQRNKVVTEGAGALASAAILSGKLKNISNTRRQSASFPAGTLT